MPSRALFVGLGSPHGDDQIGWIVVDALVSRLPSNVVARKAASPSDLLDWTDDVDLLVICDACRGAGLPGEFVQWRWPNLPSPQMRMAGSHQLGLPEVLRLAENLGRLPRRVDILGVEVADCEPGKMLSREMNAAVEKIVAAWLEEWNDA